MFVCYATGAEMFFGPHLKIEYAPDENILDTPL